MVETDGDIPVSFILTSASVHDSQAAIPLAPMTAERVTSLDDLGDAAYDAKKIRTMSEMMVEAPPRRLSLAAVCASRHDGGRGVTPWQGDNAHHDVGRPWRKPHRPCGNLEFTPI